MSYTNQQIAKQIASLLNKNKTPIFQKGTTSSTGINKEITVRMSNGKVVRALGWNVSTPGEVNVFWDAQNKRYVAWKEETSSLKRKTILASRKTRPDEKKYLWEYFIKVLQPSSIEGFDADVALDLTGYEPVGITNTGSGYIVVLGDNNGFKIFKNNNVSSVAYNPQTTILQLPYTHLGNGILTTPLYTQKRETDNNVISFTGGEIDRTVGAVGSFSRDGGVVFRGFTWNYYPVGQGDTINTTFAQNFAYKLNNITTGGSSRSCDYSVTGYDIVTYSNGTINLQDSVVYEELSGSVSSDYADRIFSYIDETETLYTQKEVVTHSGSVNFQVYTKGAVTPFGVYWTKSKYVGGSSSNYESITISPFTLSFADAIHTFHKSITNTELITYGTVITQSTNINWDGRFLHPLRIGSDCSLYLTTEYKGSIVVGGTQTLDASEGYGYITTANQSVTTHDKRDSTTLVVKTPNNLYEVCDLQGNSYDFENRFLLIGEGVINNNNITINTDANNTFEYSGNEYEIGIRFDSQEQFNTPNLKFGGFVGNILKTIIVNLGVESYGYFSVTTFNPINLPVDVFVIDGGITNHYLGLITNETHNNETLYGEGGSIYKNYQSFTIELVDNLGETFCKWQNLFTHKVIVTPQDDHTSSIMRYLYKPHTYDAYYPPSRIRNTANIFTVLDNNGNETVELAVCEIPTTTTPETLRADIYRFNTSLLKWERRPNAVTPVSPLTEISEFVSYHPTASNSRKKKRRPPRS